MRWWLLVTLAGCANVLGIPDETNVETFPIRIDVTGTIGASDNPIEVYVSDSYNDGERKLVIHEDGMAMFDAGLLNGVDFTLRSTPNCQLSRTVGRVDSAAVTATLACDGVLALADFGFSAPFETVKTATDMYRTTGSFLIEQTTTQPVTVYPESVGIASRNGVDIGTAPFTPNTDLTVRVHASPTLFTLPDRSFTTTFDLAGLPAQFGYGKPSQPSDGGHFGTAIDAYGAYLLVGMPDKGNGQAVLYSRKGRTWKEELVVDGTTGSRLGAAVAIGGNLFVVGAPGIDQVVVYTFDTGLQQWAAQTPIVGPPSSEFGAALAIAKAPNPGAFVVGAPANNLVRKYTIGGGFSPITILDQPGDRFGAAIAIADDDGRVIVGAPGDDTTFPDSGAAYVYTTPSNTTYVKLKASTPGAGDAFGSAVAFSSDGALFAVGAPLEDSGGSDETDNSKPGAGAVYLFKLPGPSVAYLKAPNADTGDGFGSSLAFRHWLGNPVAHMLVVGAPYEDSGATGVDKPSDETAPDAGAVYLLATNAVPLGATQTMMFKASNTGEGDQFGAAVAITNDSLLVGAPYEDSGATGWNGSQSDGAIDGDGGAVYTFR